MESEKNCGCKGIRTCLICEKEGGKRSKIANENKETAQYEYCPHCNLCWPLGSDSREAPLYLGRLTLIPEFITEEEEGEIVAAIDSMEWMPSQSGRKKQDFGPKVNFKKKKGKIGNFRGFPRFTEDIIKRLWQHGGLSDFHPVELCHLDYDPGRGSAIEPHIDDTWMWGERLVTLNLVSPTVLTLTPAHADANCDCRRTQGANPSTVSSADTEQRDCDISLDCPQFLNTSVYSPNEIRQRNCDIFLDCSSSDYSTDVPDSSLVHCERAPSGNKKEDCKSKCLRICTPPDAGSVIENNHRNHNCPAQCHLSKGYPYSKYLNPDSNIGEMGPKTIDTDSDIGKINPKTIHTDSNIEKMGPKTIDTDSNIGKINHETTHTDSNMGKMGPKTIPDHQCSRTPNDSKLCNHTKLLTPSRERSLHGKESNEVEAMCTAYRVGHKGLKIEVLVPLPARSLVVVAGCSRHNWFHEIRRKDIVSRRLAMTFRELSGNFISSGSDKILGDELLELGKTFWKMNVLNGEKDKFALESESFAD